ncbi:MAG: hypothetical protein IJ247_04030 [Bacilli bacterium]|nr:hypothetical protein [Bacilli bacterium]
MANKNQKYNKNQPNKKSKVWANIKFFLFSLFKNDYCVEARKKPWYPAVILGLLSVIIATVPISVMYFKRNGGQFVDSPTSSLEISLADFQQKLASKNLSMKINENHLLEVDEEAWGNAWKAVNEERKAIYPSITKSSSLFYTHWYLQETTKDWREEKEDGTKELSTKKEEHVDLAVYWFNEIGSEFDKKVSDYVKNADPEGNSKYSISAIFFGPEKFVAYKGKGNNNGFTGSITCNYNRSATTFDFMTLVSKNTHNEDNEIIYDVTKENGGLDSTNYQKYLNQTLSNWRQLFNDGWEDTRLNQAWMYTGIALGVFAALQLFLGFMVWLITRGKKNPLHVYKIWECQKIAYWASFTPALLSLIGLGLSQFAMLAFIFFFGMRIMWMSMRSLRPVGGPQQ